MGDVKLLIVGGGLAGLSAGCYARASGFDVTIVEHNLGLGGVCTAWHRGPYVIDGCIHWLTGGPFLRLYEELGIVPAVTLRPLDNFATYRHARDGWEVALCRDLPQTADALRAIAPEDADELARLVEGAAHIADLDPHLDRPPELASVSDRLQDVWRLRHDVGTFVHFREPVGRWLDGHLKSPRSRAFFSRLLPQEAPTLFLLFMLGYLSRGWLSRPVGGTVRFRDALIDRYRALGGEVVVNTTVEEVLVTGNRATGVRLTDGTMLDADVVVSTASAPETVFRLLAGRYGAAEWKARMDHWRMFQPIVLASFGVAQRFDDQSSTLLVDGIDPLELGGFRNEHLYLRIYNDDASFAPPGHTVVQAMLSTEYEWWATRGAQYQQEKDLSADRILTCLDRYLPGVKSGVHMVDLATPLTFWRNARAWRGAFEGWMPTSNAFKHVPKELTGLERFYMAGQWVEPGGGVPTAVMSGRQVVEIICAALKLEFTVPPSE
jgi:phytoene dehydrogenase-like protein